MRVAAQVFQDVLRPTERGLRVDDPLRTCGRRQVARELPRLQQRRQLVEKAQRLALVGAAKLGEEDSTEQPRQHAHRQEEARAAPYPALAVGAQPAARHDTVQVRVMEQVLTPGVEDGDEADLGTE